MRDGSRISRRGLVGLTLSATALSGPALAQLASPSVTAGFKGLDAGNGVIAYKGIPYAKPPVGTLRFMPPRRLPGPTGEQNWTRFGPPAIQNPSPSSVHPTSELGKALQTIFPTAAHNTFAPTSSGASAITRTIGSVLLGRTCTQRSVQSRRKPSSRFATALGCCLISDSYSAGNRSALSVYLSF